LTREEFIYYFALGIKQNSLQYPWNRRIMAAAKSRTERDLFPGALEMMILRTLKRQPLHGYALVQHIKLNSNDLLQIEEGSLYPALQRLLKSQLVSAEWSISSTKRRVRTYKLTASGGQTPGA
jgi:PadR family transcriptional regulator, regulatory protein PadR